jgi:hypothetical protein
VHSGKLLCEHPGNHIRFRLHLLWGDSRFGASVNLKNGEIAGVELLRRELQWHPELKASVVELKFGGHDANHLVALAINQTGFLALTVYPSAVESPKQLSNSHLPSSVPCIPLHSKVKANLKVISVLDELERESLDILA